MADPLFDQISATTLADLREDVVNDCFFVNGATLRKFRASGALDEFLGGTLMQEVFQFDRVNGGAYIPGSEVTVTQKQILGATGFAPKAYKEDIPINLFQTGVINAGPAAKVKILDGYMSNAVQALNTDLNIDIWRHGQASGTTIASNRIAFINGLAEACNDGVTNSWEGSIFSTYGGQTRNGVVGNVLNSVPLWLGDANGNTGQVAFKPFLEGYFDCVQEPDFGVCNKALYAYLLERQEAKQRFNLEQDVTIGVNGLKVMNAYIFMDKLCPSTRYGTLLPSGLSQTTSLTPTTFTSASSGISSLSNLPASKTINPGEVFFWIRAKGWKIRPAADAEYNFNFTPPVRSQTNPDMVVMFLKAAINMYTTQPRDNKQIYGAGF